MKFETRLPTTKTSLLLLVRRHSGDLGLDRQNSLEHLFSLCNSFVVFGQRLAVFLHSGTTFWTAYLLGRNENSSCKPVKGHTNFWIKTAKYWSQLVSCKLTNGLRFFNFHVHYSSSSHDFRSSLVRFFLIDFIDLGGNDRYEMVKGF